MAGILTDPRQAEGMQSADTPDTPGPQRAKKGKKKTDDGKAKAAEQASVEKRWKHYDTARKFDESFRKQIAIDRRYAAGTSDLSWAVTSNLIGAYIDILQCILYARDPDVSVRKSPQVDEENTLKMEPFARTVEIVVSYLWKKGKLKKAMKKAVRSVLSNSEGWIKATFIAEKEPNSEVETALNDARETMARLQAQEALLEDREGKSDDEIASELEEKRALIEELEDKIELSINKMFVIDYVPTENVQVSCDVQCISDYLDADWIGNELYLDKESVLERFQDLKPDDLKQAKVYYQRAPKDLTTRDIDNVLPQGMLTAETAQAFTTSQSDGDMQSPSFYRFVEIWDRRDKHLYSLIDGLKKWAKQPFVPPYPTSRFFPYFYFAFYEVDGSRHAQSLSWRLYKLQDEYSMARSNFRLMRERSIGGVLFNATGLDEEQARRIQESKHQEMTALRPSDPTTPIASLFAPKPVAAIDIRVFDPTYILNDMERISGVQEALSAAMSTPGNPKTATEANIQQSGTNARTSADRDAEEDMLTELALATTEQAIQCLVTKDVQRIAGEKAFWPFGMSIEDLFTLVEITITAGSTGKPQAAADQQAWSTLLPLIKQTLQEIEQAMGAGNMPLANAYIELIKETMHRLGDESDPDRFIPKVPPPGSPGAGAPPPPPPVQVSVALKGEISPAAAEALIGPTVQRDQNAMQPAAPAPNAPGGAPAPGGSAPAPVGTPAGAPVPQA
jgi:hypothetical protein